METQYPLICNGMVVVETEAFEQGRFVQSFIDQDGDIIALVQTNEGTFFHCLMTDLQIWSQDWEDEKRRQDAHDSRIQREEEEYRQNGSFQMPFPFGKKSGPPSR